MKRARSGSGAVGRRSPAIALIGVCLVVSAAAAQPAPAAVLPAPGEFALEGSNGFEIRVAGYPASFGSPSEVALIASRNGSYAAYIAPATATATSFAASFGPLGRVAVNYRPVGGTETRVGRCGRTISYAAGYYEGTIEFHGEGGYTDLSASAAPGDLKFLCGTATVVVSGSGIDGAVLSAGSLAGSGLFFQAVKNHPGAKSFFRASSYESNGDVGIVRLVRATAGPAAFRVTRSFRTATVTPPPPFAGTGRLRRPSGNRPHWTGNLTVDFPGHPGVPLTGSAMRASINRAELREFEGRRR